MIKTVIVNSEGLAKALGIKKGGEMQVKCDKHGTPLIREWRNRFRDMKADKCISVKDRQSKKKEAS